MQARCWPSIPKASWPLRRRGAGKLGQRVFVLDPFGTTGGKVKAYASGFNPVALMRPEFDDRGRRVDRRRSGGFRKAAIRIGMKAPGLLSRVSFSKSPRPRDSRAARSGDGAGPDRGRGEFRVTRAKRFPGCPCSRASCARAGSLRCAVRRPIFSSVRSASAIPSLSTARRHLRALSFPEIERSLRGEGLDLAA